MGGVLRTGYKSTSGTDPAFGRWRRIQQWCAFLDQAKYPKDGTAEIPTAIVDEFIGDESLSYQLFANLRTEDDASKVLGTLAAIRHAKPEAGRCTRRWPLRWPWSLTGTALTHGLTIK
ncbi:hypothetical protein [Verrucomicrobium spinosum]|uniref:hypothetical protein n=1 Tax=Verrucomicrobium spinosum TaxID=2736 RepID=UPI0009465D65|nr:hypothetical protein [Verrucomicrobium spinosum]